ncbi:hypothetical protein BH10PLA2_BH10PLA2_33780 [soil metagenome]
MSDLLPVTGPSAANLVARPAADGEMAQIRALLPQAFWGHPRPQYFVAIHEPTGELVGAATVRILLDAGVRGTGYFLVRTVRNDVAFECASLLMDAVAKVAQSLSIGRLESGCLFEESDPCVAVMRGRGMTVLKERHRFHVDSLARAIERISPLYRRVQRAGRIPHNASIGGLEHADQQALVAFIVQHLGGFPEFVQSRLDGSNGGYCPRVSSVVKLGQRIVGLVLCQTLGDRRLLVDRRAVARDCRGGWVNLAIMQRGLEEGLRLGYESFDLQGDSGKHEDTFKLAKRLDGVLIGREFSFFQELGVPALRSEQGRLNRAPSPESFVRNRDSNPATATTILEAGVPLPSIPQVSRHTPSFAEILERLDISLAVTTGHTGQLILLRAEQGVVHSHHRSFGLATGLAVDGDRLALGTAHQIWEFHNAPAVADRLEPVGAFDACYLPRFGHVTGDIRLQEMAWADGELWFTNTRFSCLATRDPRYSFVPRWQPPFISALAPEDRCHLNGLCRVPPSLASTLNPSWFVTALGATDTPEGWRQCLNDGGVLMDTGVNEVLVRNLSLPHSPRCHADQLWLLESGKGTAGIVDRSAGRYQAIAELPGFPRGLDFCGRYAFVGLSQMRHFGRVDGIPLTERLGDERRSGIWVLDVVSGEMVGFLEFADPIQDVYAVQVLVGRRRVDLVREQSELALNSFVVPDVALESEPTDYLCHTGEQSGQPAHDAVGS